ncbi:hypothetical protein DKP24_06450 [Salmonella enterica subsp. enterica serovar Stanley]|nr:hypothetical protein [Salmonella enterica subsp. enterica serovar Stanley]EBD5371626.1 hypothetical protein [Salmonella enterica]EDV4431161.1 hypothetical protein [Salmonella enterica subsp. enterica]EBL0338593.1 hypothetical protein [Salmonella enterica]EBU6643136.1 hypothetical protein [Salmonella enterica subsp. enterica serovar Stanley]
MVGAQKGALRSIVCTFLLFFIVLNDDLSPAFAPSDAIISYLRVAFFVSISVQIRLYPSVIQR